MPHPNAVELELSQPFLLNIVTEWRKNLRIVALLKLLPIFNPHIILQNDVNEKIIFWITSDDSKAKRSFLCHKNWQQAKLFRKKKSIQKQRLPMNSAASHSMWRVYPFKELLAPRTYLTQPTPYIGSEKLKYVVALIVLMEGARSTLIMQLSKSHPKLTRHKMRLEQ